MPVFFPQVLQRNPRPQPCVEIDSLGNYQTFDKACLREQEPKDLFLVVAVVHISNHLPIFAREEALLVVLNKFAVLGGNDRSDQQRDLQLVRILRVENCVLEPSPDASLWVGSAVFALVERLVLWGDVGVEKLS